MDDMDDGDKGAPKFMVLYCSIMILLLAFFITLQSMASEQQPGMFNKGKGSFVRALRSFGLGRLFSSHGLSDSGKVSRRYPSPRESSQSATHPSDPEQHRAQEQLEKMKDNLEDDSGESDWAATLFAPSNEEDFPDELNQKQKKFFKGFARGALPALFAQNSLIGVGARYPGGENGDKEAATKALRLAQKARETVIDSVKEDLQDIARKRVYSFCRPAGEEDAPDRVRVYFEAAKLEKTSEENAQE